MPEAVKALKAKNALPGICGRVCPQETQCEVSLHPGKKGSARGHRPPGAIRGRLGTTEYQAAERQGGDQHLASGKKVAVVGSGPAGLTAAADLAKMGHKVTIFEALHVAGGVLMYGIPEFRLPKAIVQSEVNFVTSLGVKIELDSVVGKLNTVDELLDDGYSGGLSGHRRRAADVPGYPRGKPERHLLGQRVPHPGQPDEGLPVPRVRYAGEGSARGWR